VIAYWQTRYIETANDVPLNIATKGVAELLENKQIF